MMHARELKGGEARSKEHVVRVEVSVRGEHRALGSAPTLAGLCHLREPHGRKSALHRAGSKERAESRQRHCPGPGGRGRQGEQEKGQPGWCLGGGEQGQHGEGFLWAEEFSSRQAQGEQLARGKHREE